MPIDTVEDYYGVEYRLVAVIPGVNITVTMLTPGSQPTSSTSVASDGTVTISLGIPSTMGIKDVSISQDGVITVTMDDDSTETFDGMKTAIQAANSAATSATTAASQATAAKTAAETATTEAQAATTAATSAATAANNAATAANTAAQNASGDIQKNSELRYQINDISANDGLYPFRIKKGDWITITITDVDAFTTNDQLRLYRADRSYISYISTLLEFGNSRTSVYNGDDDVYYVGMTAISDLIHTYDITNSGNIYYKQIDKIKSKLEISAQEDLINRFNKDTITNDKYLVVSTGTLAVHISFFASDYIYIGDLDSVTLSYTHIVCWYGENKDFISQAETMNSRNADVTLIVPETAKYLRFSTYKEDLDKAQIGKYVTRANYVPYGIYHLPGLRINSSQINDEDESSKIIVDASGGGDYTSFTRALYENVSSGIDVIVKPGTYDIVAEYVELFGQSAVDNMADADGSIFNGFQYGVIIRNREIEFAPGAHLVCDWTGHTVDGTHRFSAIRVDYNCKIIGLDLVSTATFYAIHDDYGLQTLYTVEYENCHVEGINLVNANCIGGGCKKYSRHILNGCYFNNNLTTSAVVRYHNTNAEGAEPEVYVKNCYFNSFFTPRWYGPQTSKMRVYVSGCEAMAIYKMQESVNFDVDNVELYKWNNTETAPRS